MSLLSITILVLACNRLFPVECTCPEGFVRFGKSCYWFSNIKATFANARSYCNFLNSHLAVISCSEEDAFVRETARNKTGRHFLGATDLHLDSPDGKEWLWEGGLEMTYTNWGEGEPSTKEEHCLDLLDAMNYLWNDAYCSWKQKFICERCIT